MQWARRSISWTSFSSPWVRARDSSGDVDLAVGRPIVPPHTGRGYRVPRYVVSSVPTSVRGRHLTPPPNARASAYVRPRDRSESVAVSGDRDAWIIGREIQNRLSCAAELLVQKTQYVGDHRTSHSAIAPCSKVHVLGSVDEHAIAATLYAPEQLLRSARETRSDLVILRTRHLRAPQLLITERPHGFADKQERLRHVAPGTIDVHRQRVREAIEIHACDDCRLERTCFGRGEPPNRMTDRDGAPIEQVEQSVRRVRSGR